MASVAGRLEVEGDVLQDPYVKATLHDGKFSEGGHHVGQSFKTTTKDDAGSSATWNEMFELNKPEHMDNLRIELWDENVLIDDFLGCIDIDLKQIFQEEGKKGKWVPRELELVKDGKTTAHVQMRVRINA